MRNAGLHPVGTVLSKVQACSLPHAAVIYAAAGLAVFPCVPAAKRPLTDHGFRDASVDPQQVAAWWRRWPEANIGLATGRPDGFDVVDVDVRRSGSGFAALRRARAAGVVDGWAAMVRTPSGGVHFYFPARAEAQGSWSLARDAHVDFRGRGGYVLVPPSFARSGGVQGIYALIATSEEARALDAGTLRRLLAPPVRGRHPLLVERALDRPQGEPLAAWLASQGEGNRNRALFWAACRLAERAVDEEQARRVLTPAAAHCGLGAREIERTLASAFRSFSGRSLPSRPLSGPSAKTVSARVQRISR
ncbi:MAG: bifunctional DNA primase/polymerase [Solirubrobacteraceae bacterium]